MKDAFRPVLAEHVGPLAHHIAAAVPNRAFPVRFANEWNAFADGKSLRKFTADFSGEEGGPEIPELLESSTKQLATGTFERRPDDEEWSRSNFVQGDDCVRIWPATGLLVECMLDVVRYELQRPGKPADPRAILGDLYRFVDELGIVPTRVVSETFVAVGNDLPGGASIEVSFSIQPGVIATIERCGYARCDGVFKRSISHDGEELALSVKIEQTRGTWIADFGTW
jgi:hypothetical protein